MSNGALGKVVTFNVTSVLSFATGGLLTIIDSSKSSPIVVGSV